MEKLNIDLTESQLVSVANDVQASYNITVSDKTDITFNFPENSHGNVFITLLGEGDLDLQLIFGDYSNWSYLILNESDHALNIKETVTLHKEAYIKANYGELSNGQHVKNTNFVLDGAHSHLDVRGASIAFGELEWHMSALHRAKDSYAMLQNYGIVFTGGRLTFEVLGDIEKGQSRSKTHQITRVMNMDEQVRARVFPKLVIDENDVEASHAASVGQPDPEAIYYMRSRGLSLKETLQQMTLGYLLPIVDVIEDEEVKEQLAQNIYSKVMQ
ncbi:MAG TPA: SufD family Fe-S cluster assembly protein [Erysipelothrix sp.]|jgi:Fe-S cluster assembly scaffold protein SufB|nr:SufD family Fe-S cluster assembly protein [Erysipelothrix sp.]